MKLHKAKDVEFRCVYCGRFISYRDVGTKKIGSKYTHDSALSTESMEFWHTKCENKITREFVENLRKVMIKKIRA